MADPIIILRKNVRPILEKGYVVNIDNNEAEKLVQLRPVVESIDRKYHDAGEIIKQTNFTVNGQGGVSYAYTVSVNKGGLMIRPLTNAAATHLIRNRSSVVERGIYNAVNRLDAGAPDYRTIYLNLVEPY